MKFQVMAKMQGKTRPGCFGTYYGEQQKAAAEKHARSLARCDGYSRVKLIEIPDAADNKPYKKKEVICKP